MTLYVEAAEGARRHAVELLAEMTGRLRAEGLAVESERREGDAAAELIAAARAWKANLVVLGTRGRTGVTRLVLGSVARNVVHHVPSSVMIVHGVAAAREASEEKVPAEAGTRG
jgi:nucleotide-binding universal stress UspA family protein